MIQFIDVVKRYRAGHAAGGPAFEALRGIGLEVAKGEFVAITGHSGAGKSTLLKLAGGLELASSGKVLVNGQDLSGLKEAGLAALRRHVGFVFQNHKLLHDRNVFDNVALPLAIAAYADTDSAKRVRAALDKVGLLAREKAYPVGLSGGEQQRLCIARAIVSRPAILIADEPTGNLDGEYAAAIMALFLSFNQVGVTVLLASHDEASLARVPCRRIRLNQGRIAT